MAIKIQTLPNITGIGTAPQVNPNHIAVTSLTLQSEDDNTGDIYIGDSSVTVGTGLILVPGATAEITADGIGKGGADEFFIDEVYLISSTSANVVRAAAFRRRL